MRRFEEDRAPGRSFFPGPDGLFYPQSPPNPSKNPIRVAGSRTWQERGDVAKSSPVLLAETEYKRTVAGRIRQARRDKGISQETLGELTGKPRTQINGWENARGQPQWKNLVLLAEKLDVTPHWLLTGHDDNGDPQ